MIPVARTAALLFCLAAFTATLRAEVIPCGADACSTSLTSVQPNMLLSESHARFTRGANEWCWVSDTEHVFWKPTGQAFLADADPPFYITGDTIPAGRDFELFPYHYFGTEESEPLGTDRLNYRLVAVNRTTATVTLTISGNGNTTDWEHAKAWEGALRGDGSTTITISPGATTTLWEARGLKAGLPWSAVVFGRTDGDLWVADYCFRGERDPGIAKAQPMPDLAWPPHLLASFTRGHADWFSATVDLFPRQRGDDGAIPVSLLAGKSHSVPIGYSPGGPVTDLCEYKAVEPAFAADQYYVTDPVSGHRHVFFGGNYPVCYRMPLPLANDTADTRTVTLHLSANDRLYVDSLAGVWLAGRFDWRRVAGSHTDAHWRFCRVVLAPGAHETVTPVIVSPGSRWGGLIFSIAVE